MNEREVDCDDGCRFRNKHYVPGGTNKTKNRKKKKRKKIEKENAVHSDVNPSSC